MQAAIAAGVALVPTMPALCLAQTLVMPNATLAAGANAVNGEQQGGQRGNQGVRFVWREHPSLRFGRALRLDFQAKFQEDGRDPGDDPIDFETWELHRLRVGIDGEIFNRVQFSIERELYERENDDEGTGSNPKN